MNQQFYYNYYFICYIPNSRSHQTKAIVHNGMNQNSFTLYKPMWFIVLSRNKIQLTATHLSSQTNKAMRKILL